MVVAVADLASEAARLRKEGKSPAQIRFELEGKGYAADEIASHLGTPEVERTAEDRKNSRLFSIREFFDRAGYGGASPQFINILLYLAYSAHPFILPFIGVLNGLRTLLSVVWSGVLQEYAKLHRISKNTIAAAGIVYGFSFLFMAFGLLLKNTLGLVLFALSFLLGTVAVVAYGDLYARFVRDTIRKERMGFFLRTIGTWGVIITAAMILFAGYLLDVYPLGGTPWSMDLFGRVYEMRLYGFLIAFEITAFCFIIAGYVSSLIADTRERRTYSFTQFCREHLRIVRHKIAVFGERPVFLLLLATIVNGVLGIIIGAYSGIAIYQYIAANYGYPFFTIAILYSIAIIASFTGPFFTQVLHRSTGLAPMLVFGTLLAAILPLAIVYKPYVWTFAAALCLHVIGMAIVGVGQSMLAQKIMDEETRRSYFQAQSAVIVIPYLVLIPLVGITAHLLPLHTLLLIAAGGFIGVAMPLYLILVVIGQHQRL